MRLIRQTAISTMYNRRFYLTFRITVSQRDAEYIVECLRLLLQEERIAERMVLSLDRGGISDEAIDVFGGLLRERPCLLHSLCLWNLPPRQVRRLLASLHTNTSVKELWIDRLLDNDGASWVADLLRHKKDFTHLYLYHCCFPLMQLLPLLRGQSNLKSLTFNYCRNTTHSSNGDNILLFNDPEFSRLFVDNILLSPRTALKTLYLHDCGVSLENRPLMAGFHKNTTLVGLFWSPHDAATRLFIDPIMRRNVYLGHIHDMLGMTTLTGHPAGVGEIVIVPTIPPPCGLWATVLTKAGQGTQGSSPVFTILRDRLATWIEPSLHWQQVPHLPVIQRELLEQKEQCNDSSCPPSQPATVQSDTGATIRHGSATMTGGLAAATELVAVVSLLEKKKPTEFQHDSAKATVAVGGCRDDTIHSSEMVAPGTGWENMATNTNPPVGTEEQQPVSSKKRTASSTEMYMYSSSSSSSSSKKKKPKSDM